jgi:hypothetical protein
MRHPTRTALIFAVLLLAGAPLAAAATFDLVDAAALAGPTTCAAAAPPCLGAALQGDPVAQLLGAVFAILRTLTAGHTRGPAEG